MTLRKSISILLLAFICLVFLLGCSNVSEGGDQPSAEERATTQRLAQGEIASVHPAKVCVKKNTGGNMSATICYKRTFRELVEENEGTTASESESIEEGANTIIETQLGSRRPGKITVNFVEHRDGADVWELDILTTTIIEENNSSNEITEGHVYETSFDGENPALVREDEHHSIWIIPESMDCSSVSLSSQ